MCASVVVTKHALDRWAERSGGRPAHELLERIKNATLLLHKRRGAEVSRKLLKTAETMIMCSHPFYLVFNRERDDWVLVTVTDAKPFELLGSFEPLQPRPSPFAHARIRLHPISERDLPSEQFPPDFDAVESAIDAKGWYRFGSKPFGCPEKVIPKMISFFIKNKTLPPPCNECYKVLIFWSYSRENVEKFFNLVKGLAQSVRGKLNRETVVFYFRKKDEALAFFGQLAEKMKESGVIGTPQWRRACREYQTKVPTYWKDAKTFAWE